MPIPNSFRDSRGTIIFHPYMRTGLLPASYKTGLLLTSHIVSGWNGLAQQPLFIRVSGTQAALYVTQYQTFMTAPKVLEIDSELGHFIDFDLAEIFHGLLYNL
jgi:hypothetical protein